MRITTDTFAYCAEELPRWNMISISGYHIREAGSTAVQELAFTLSNAIAYVEAAVEAGVGGGEVAARLSFFFYAPQEPFPGVGRGAGWGRGENLGGRRFFKKKKKIQQR